MLIDRDGAVVHISDDKAAECQWILDQIRPHWPQFAIDGFRNIWIVKPGDKSKGIGWYWRYHLWY